MLEAREMNKELTKNLNFTKEEFDTVREALYIIDLKVMETMFNHPMLNTTLTMIKTGLHTIVVEHRAESE